MSSSPGLNVSLSNVPASAGTQYPNMPSQSSQSSVAQQPTVGQNQQMQSTIKQSHQTPVQNSSTFPVRDENVPSTQSSQPWPKMTQSNVQKYTKVFLEIDTDRDGKITGEQAHTLFLSWRLPREILKQVWDLSDQDNDSMLSLKEFCIALYLMERYREGLPLPRVLPAGVMFEETPLPPSDQTPAANSAPVWRPAPGVQQGHRMTGQRQVTHAAARPPRAVPDPVPIATADEDVQPRHQKPRVRVLEKLLVDQLSPEEQSSLNSKFQEATEADTKVGELEKKILEAKQKTVLRKQEAGNFCSASDCGFGVVYGASVIFCLGSSSSGVLYKSRCDIRLNEITERVSADRREVESLSKKYEDKYKQAGDVTS
ncbi:hypothetical protein L6452_10215 [Arctium lappa]|uniref:Uncharacterized protein n=1 Tax=Arctium lappa TaxID=4217 RepID=A0ACB9DLV7_ARCLA|nr:hypothetical protein L6452_10215 [Arctium lappa]